MAGKNRKFEPKDCIKDFIFFFLTVAVSYGYILLMLLIFSFIFVSVIPLKFEHMLVISGVGAVIVALWYIVKMVKKYRN